MSARVRVRARTCAYEIRLCKLSRTMMVAAVAAADHDPPYSPLPTNLFFLASLFTQDREKALGTRLFFGINLLAFYLEIEFHSLIGCSVYSLSSCFC